VSKKDDKSSLPHLAGLRYDFKLAAANDAMSGRVGADRAQIISKAAH
jgi:hypothetical protein